MVAGMQADNRTVISLVEGTSYPDWSTMPKVGESVKAIPTFTVTTGKPAYFYIDNSCAYWEKMIDGEWEEIDDGTFNSGTWRFRCLVLIDGNTDPNGEYVLAEDVKVKVNGEEWETSNYDFWPGYNMSSIWASSPEITVEDDRTVISLVEVTTYPDWSTMPKVGESVKAIPTFTVTTGKPAYFYIDNSCAYWEKMIDGEWEEIDDGTFNSGTWRFRCLVLIDGNTDPNGEYVLAEDVKVKVNGEEWETSNYDFWPGYNMSRIWVSSPEIIVEEPREGKLGNQGTWSFADGVLTVDYMGAMPQNCTSKTTDPEVAYRLKWIDFLSEIKEIVITGVDVEVQPYFLYYSGDGDLGQHPDDHIKKLTLGSGVKKVGKQAFASYDLKDVYCYGVEPPELSSDTGNGNVFWKSRIQANQAFLHLVRGASTGYAMINSEWAIFNHSAHALDPEDDPVDVKSIDNGQLTIDNEKAWYSLDGRKLGSKPTMPGLYIKNGKKVVVK